MSVRVFSRAAALGTALPILCLLCAGCSSGPEMAEIRGKVTFRGQPVSEGTVTFLNLVDGGSAEGEIQSGGTFSVSGSVVPGDYVVEIKPLMEIVDSDPGKTPPTPMEKAAPNIPRKYRMQGTTPLKETVKAGQNEFHFDMQP